MSELAFAAPSNPQSLNLYTYALNNPLAYTDPSGMSCMKNSTPSGSGDQYVDNGDGQGCKAAGINPDGSETQRVISKTVYADGRPSDDGNAAEAEETLAEMQDKLNKEDAAQPDPDTARIQALVQGVAQKTAGFPTICSVGASAQIGYGEVSAGVSYDTNSGTKGNAGLNMGSAGLVSTTLKVTENGASGTVTVRAPFTGVGGGLSVNNNGTPTVSVSERRGPVTVAATATLGTIGNSQCQHR